MHQEDLFLCDPMPADNNMHVSCLWIWSNFLPLASVNGAACSLINFGALVQHIRNQYEELRPILTALEKAYPDYVLADHVSWDSYLWAVSLIYSYGMEVSSTLCSREVFPYVSVF